MSQSYPLMGETCPFEALLGRGRQRRHSTG